MKKVLKSLSFLLVIGSGIVTLFNMNKTNKRLVAKETTSFQVKQTLAAIAATLEKTKEEETARAEEPKQPKAKSVKTEATSKQEDPPLIKANKNARGEYIYHVPGGVFYNRTTPVEWFHTEEEAQAKGYRKSAR